MKTYRLLLIIMFVFPVVSVNAQSFSDYYHKAANFYINGEKKNAKKAIEEAINKFPNDPKAKKLADAINKLPDDKPNNGGSQNKPDPKPKEQPQQPQQPKPQPQQPQMSKQNAQQILDALQQDEKNAQDKAKKQQVRGTIKSDIDW
jgi:Ca-activated chloride channel family protein